MNGGDLELNAGGLTIEEQKREFTCVNINDAPNAGDISFVVGDYGEVVKLNGNGDIYVKGNLVTNDIEVINGLKEFLSMSERYTSNWKDTAAQMCSNMEYYRGLVEKIGNMLGEEAYISDDGSRQQDVLCAKVPELVAQRLGIPLEHYLEIIEEK